MGAPVELDEAPNGAIGDKVTNGYRVLPTVKAVE